MGKNNFGGLFWNIAPGSRYIAAMGRGITVWKSIVCIILMIACVLLSSCSKNSSAADASESSGDAQDRNGHAALIVNGKDITSEKLASINYEKQYAQLPLLAILEALGGETEWVDEEKVTIAFHGTTYVLNPAQNTLQKEGDSFNIIAVPPGTRHGGYYEICDEEFLIDSNCLDHFLYLLGARIAIDYDRALVTIDFVKNTASGLAESEEGDA